MANAVRFLKFLLLLSIVVFILNAEGTDDKKKEGEGAGEDESLFDIYKKELKKEMVPTWRKLMRFPYKTCLNWQEIQRGQTDFTTQKMICLTNCYLDDYCTGVMVIIGQERGCRYLSGTCYIDESYDWEYFHKFVPFSATPYMLGIDDQSVRFLFAQLSWAQARCWIYQMDPTKTGENYNLKNRKEKDTPENTLTRPADAMIGFIMGAYAITTLMNVKKGEFYFDKLTQETFYQLHCANAAGAKSNPIVFKTTDWPLDRIRNSKMGCIEGQTDAEIIGTWKRVGMSFCREMCIRRQCYSYMYGRPDGANAGTCYLTMSCGKKIAQSMDEWNLYTLRNLDYDVIKSNSKCTPAIGSPDNPILMPPMKLLGTRLINPISCRKMCYNNPACEFFLFGKQGSQKGSCYQVNSDCQTFEPNVNFDVWKLIRQPFHWHRMNAECVGGNLYIGDNLTFDQCRLACSKKVNCNFFTRADMDATDHGVCLGALSCDKTRPSTGFFVYQVLIPPPLDIEDIERDKKEMRLDRLGKERKDSEKDLGDNSVGGGGNKRRRRLLEMSYNAGLGQEFVPQLKIPLLPAGHSASNPKDEGYYNAFIRVLLELPLTEKFLYFVWPLVFGGFCGLLVERFQMRNN